MKKAAVVIGVDKTGKLVPLASAAAGARRVADWLEAEGFKVNCLTDQAAPVTAEAVRQAIGAFVTVPPRYHLLLVYFSGHGYWQARSDLWLLSGAPQQPGEAVNLRAAMDLAKYSGIENVVFVSDACRSLPDARSGAFVDGVAAFPNFDEFDKPSKIDCFKATSEARPAYEGRIGGEAQSVLTAAWQAAYREPEDAMVLQIDGEGGEKIEVVPNRRLEDFLQRKVDALMAAIDPNASQQIEVSVPSREEVYIARVRREASAAARHGPRRGNRRRGPTPAGALEAPVLAAPPGRVAASAIVSALASGAGVAAAADGATAVVDAATEQRLRARMPDPAQDHFESQTGFVVQGAVLRRAVAARGGSGLSVDLLTGGDGSGASGLLRVKAKKGFVVPDGHVGSIGLQFADGRCAVLAALPGYIGHVTVGSRGVTNVSYLPSSNHWRWNDYVHRRDEVDRLRAMVALAIDRNSFQLRSDAEAEALARRIRMYKAVDPTLGLYAAMAFAQASNDAQLLSVLQYMRADLRADLFDVLLLASRQPAARAARLPVVPLCPMLTQNWSLLASRGVKLAPAMAAAGQGLADSLWTTFEPEVSRALLRAIEEGELT